MIRRTSQVRHPVFGRVYARLSGAPAANGAAAHRDEMLAGTSGRFIEVRAGNGLNFAHCPTTVTEVVAVEPELHLRRLARIAADATPVDITLIEGTADAVPVEDAGFDVVAPALLLRAGDGIGRERRTQLTLGGGQRGHGVPRSTRGRLPPVARASAGVSPRGVESR